MKTSTYKFYFFPSLFLLLLLCGNVSAQRGAIAQVAFRTSSGHYLCAEGGGGREIVANRTAIGPWESFITDVNFDGGYHVDLYNGKFALLIRGKYVSAQGGGGGAVFANSDTIGPWETFTLEIMRSYVNCGRPGPDRPATLYLFVATGNVSSGGTSATVRMKVSFEDWEITDITDAKGHWAGQTKTLYSNWAIPTKGLCGKLSSMELKTLSVYLESDTTFSDQWYLESISAGTSKDSISSSIRIGKWIEQGKWYTFATSPNQTKR